MKGNKSQEDKSFIRWQQITITQMGYVINLILGLSVASLGFLMSILSKEKITFSCWGKTLFVFSSIFILVSIAVGLWLVISRLKDFRETTQIAGLSGEKEKESDPTKKSEYDKELKRRRALSEELGKKTWSLFYTQISFFSLGVICLIVFFVISYKERLF